MPTSGLPDYSHLAPKLGGGEGLDMAVAAVAQAASAAAAAAAAAVISAAGDQVRAHMQVCVPCPGFLVTPLDSSLTKHVSVPLQRAALGLLLSAVYAGMPATGISILWFAAIHAGAAQLAAFAATGTFSPATPRGARFVFSCSCRNTIIVSSIADMQLLSVCRPLWPQMPRTHSCRRSMLAWQHLSLQRPHSQLGQRQHSLRSSPQRCLCPKRTTTP